MKNLVKALLVVIVLVEVGYSQNINWKSFKEEQRNALQFNAGYDFGASAQVGYARSFSVIKPVIVGLDYSFPMGGNLTDDFKVRLGGQIEILQLGEFSTTIKIYSNFRRYQSQLVRAVSFGSDFAIVTGYYTYTWYAAGELGFDKAIATHLKHSDIMRASFPAIQDGWYVPTGGNYYYGIQGGKTIGEILEVSLRLGATSAQDHDENAVLPFYLQLGLGVRF
jgi:hypothetical protein